MLPSSQRCTFVSTFAQHCTHCCQQQCACSYWAAMQTPLLLLALQAAALLAPTRRPPRLRRTRLQAASTRRRGLHRSPDLEQDGYLEVGDGHEIYYQVKTLKNNFGEPLPCLWLHGGPGAGVIQSRTVFDPEKWRIVVGPAGLRQVEIHRRVLGLHDTPRLVNARGAADTSTSQMGLRPGRLLGLDARLSLCPVPPFFSESLVLQGVFDATLETMAVLAERRRHVVGSERCRRFETLTRRGLRR